MKILYLLAVLLFIQRVGCTAAPPETVTQPATLLRRANPEEHQAALGHPCTRAYARIHMMRHSTSATGG